MTDVESATKTPATNGILKKSSSSTSSRGAGNTSGLSSILKNVAQNHSDKKKRKAELKKIKVRYFVNSSS